jgi:two-component system phosphate regulon sensor histidine kinase PhoR
MVMRSALLTSLPAAAALAGLVGMERLAAGDALLALAGVAGLAGLLLRRRIAELQAVADYARRLADGDDGAPPEVARPPAERLLSAVTLLRKAWRASEAELNGRLASVEITLDSLPDPLLLLDRRHRIVRANRSARALFGRTLDGHELSTVLRDPGVLEALEQALGGGPAQTLEFPIPRPTARTFGAMIEPLPNRTAEGAEVMLALHDLTAIKRAEQLRADFVANASHELRTPLAAVLGFVETLRGPARDDREAHDQFLGIMHEQATRMSRLVADLLSLSRIELSEHTPPSDKVDLAQLLEQIRTGLALQAGQRGMTVAVILPPDLPPVLGHADELSQVFHNLIDNALKYGRDGTAVEVSAAGVERIPTATGPRSDHGAVRVAVRDHGDGIAREHLPRLTERFYRVDTARSRKMGGTGLGLAIVKHIINRHRGSLTIDSTVGEGTTVTVYLPSAG